MGAPNIPIGILLLFTASLISSQIYNPDLLIRSRRQINVHDIPKTSFSCNDKQPGEYYADTEVACQAYHICIPGPFGKLTQMSFACPNGTIFSQATRVCSTTDRVYCPLAKRFYDNLHGALDTDKDEYEKSRASPFSDLPYNALHQQRRPVQAVPETSITDYADDDYDVAPPLPSTTTRAPSRRGQGSSSRRFQPQQARPTQRTTPRTTPRPPPPPPPRTTQAPTSRPSLPVFRTPFRTIPGSVVLRGPQTVQTEPPAPVLPPVPSSGTPPVGPPPIPFDAISASGTPPLAQPILPANAVPSGTPPIPSNAFSAGTPPIAQPPIPSNAFAIGTPQVIRPAQPAFRFPQRPQLRRPGTNTASTTTTTTTTTEAPLIEYEYYDYEEDPNANTQRTTSTRTKRAIPVREILSPIPNPRIPPLTSFTCQDKVAGWYADIETDCELFHICVPIGKGKLLDYGLFCDNGTAFNQEAGACDEKDSFTCDRGLRFAKKDKTKLYLSGQKPWKTPKSPKRKTREAEKEYEIQSFPLTSFNCENKTIGGYYADPETDCQMFHICTSGLDGQLVDMRFLCTNGTIFNQRLLVCQNEELVTCDDSPDFYQNEFTKFLERERVRAEEDERIQKEADIDLLKYTKKGDAKRRKKATGFVKIIKTL